MQHSDLPLAITYIIVWIIIGALFYIAGVMKLKEEEEKCNRCKYKYVCNGLCVNKDGRYNIK